MGEGTSQNSEYVGAELATAAVAGSASAVALGTARASLVKIYANSGNNGVVYWGGPGVTALTGIPIAAGTSTEWIPVRALSDVYQIGSDANQTARIVYVKRGL